MVGVSSARNVGLEVATGEYVGFVDPDDWIEPTMYEQMYNTIKRTHADLCMCNYVMEFPGQSVAVLLPLEKDFLNREGIISDLIANMLSSTSLNSGMQTIMGSVWRLLANRDLIEKNALRFTAGVPLMEDLIFCVETLVKCSTVIIDRGQYYHYVIHDNSAASKFRPDMFSRLHDVFDRLQNILEKEQIYHLLEERMNLRYVNMNLSFVVNEVHVDNKKSSMEKIQAIKQFCQDEKLKGILGAVDTKGYTLRKRLVLTALEREWAFFLFAYYTILTRLMNR